MEILKQLWVSQDALEDALRMEITPEEVEDTKEGKTLYRWIKRRRRVIDHLTNVLNKI